MFDIAIIFSIGSKSLNLRKKAAVKFNDLFLYKLNELKETLATFL